MKRTDTSTLLDAVRERLDALMKERKRSGADVARSAGLGKGTLNAFLSGKSEDITLGSLFRVAAELGIHASDLLPEIKGSEPRRDPTLDLAIASHASPAFRPAATAFLALYTYSTSATSAVRTVAHASFNESFPWTPNDWFEELNRYHFAAMRRLRLPPP